jgi:TetR/AcrR family transcriptional regulator, transcriptional repressor for nem operon
MAAQRQRGEIDTRSEILDVAERLVQSRGFNAFSYADIATELGLTKPALHYHFASKAELGEALIARYSARFVEALDRVSSECTDGRSKLEAYADLYRKVLAQQRMCLCGMLAADYATLPQAMRGAVMRFFDENEAWLAQALEQGRREGTLRFSGPSREAARMLIGALEGAMLVARPYGDVARFETMAARLIAVFTPIARTRTGSSTRT